MKKHYWGWMIATYLFLGGLGGGIFSVLAILENFYDGGGYGVACLTAAIIGFICIAIGLVLLLADLGQPKKFVRVFTTKTSIIKWGAVLLSITTIAGLFYILSYLSELWTWLAWCSFLIPGRGAFIWAAGITGFCVMIYTGVLLSSLKAHSLWATPALPVLFTVSALSTGCAVTLLTLGGWPFGALGLEGTLDVEAAHSFVHTLDASLMFSEIIILFLFILMHRGAGNETAVAASKKWLTGIYAGWFWIGLVACGLVIPLLLTTLVGGVLGTVLAPCMALVGGFILRFIVVYTDDRRMVPGEASYNEKLPSFDAKFINAWGMVDDYKARQK